MTVSTSDNHPFLPPYTKKAPDAVMAVRGLGNAER